MAGKSKLVPKACIGSAKTRNCSKIQSESADSSAFRNQDPPFPVTVDTFEM